MNFKINRETIPATELIYSGIQEQGVELDYILPDYYPDIFRLIRCEIHPAVTGWSVAGDKLSYELICDICLIYCGESGTALQCITQRQTFSKSLELPRSPEMPAVSLVPKSDHVNFRAVNKRRLDVRGAVSVKITVNGEKSQEVISDAFGMNIQLKKIPIKYAAKKITADKLIQLSDETELSAAQPPVVGVIRYNCTVGDCEKKIISGKLLAKGTVMLDILYSCESGIEPLKINIPFSQIVDLDELDDTFNCSVTADIIGCTITPISDKNGDNRILRTEPELRLSCLAVKPAEVMVAADAYSTIYPCELESADIHGDLPSAVYAETFRHNAKIAEGDSVPNKIYAMWCTPKNINTRLGNDGKSVIISGMLTYSMAAGDTAGAVSMPDRDEAFEQTIEIGDDLSECAVSAEICDISVSYNISDTGILNARADISVKITADSSAGAKALIDISIDDSARKKRDGDYAVKLYFGTDNEDIWDAAKRFSTEVSAIMEENELTSEHIEKGKMLLIPIVD